MIKNKPVKILFISHSGEWGGAQKSILAYINYLFEKKLNVSPIFVFGSQGGFYNEIRKKNIPCYITSLLRLTKYPFSFKNVIWWVYQFFFGLIFICHLMIRHRIDIIHTNTIFNFQGALAAKVMRKKHVWHIREDLSLPYFRFILPYVNILKIINALSDKIVCISEVEERLFEDKSKVEVIYNTWQLSIGYKANKREHTGIGKIVFSQFGTIFPNKNQKWFIDSFIELCKIDDNCFAYLIGKQIPGHKDYFEALMNQINRSGFSDRIKIIPFTEDIEKWYQLTDVMVNPMLKGIVGRITIEAMAHGIPCIGNSDGIEQGIVKHGEDGLLVPFDNVLKLTNAMKKMMDSNIRKKMGKNAYKKAMETLNINQYGSKLYNAHKSLKSTS